MLNKTPILPYNNLIPYTKSKTYINLNIENTGKLNKEQKQILFCKTNTISLSKQKERNKLKLASELKPINLEETKQILLPPSLAYFG